MELPDFIAPESVVFAVRVKNKEQLLRDLASRAAASLNLDAETIFAALQKREQLGSTGLGEGFALPHARIERLDRFFGMFARLSRPIPFDSIDDRPVDLVFLLLIPAAAQKEDLTVLATISRHMRDKEFAASLRRAGDAGAFRNLLCARLGMQRSHP